MTTVEVYADIWCPFTHVGLKRLVARREEIGVALDIRAKAWPLELVNGAPLGSDVVAEEIDELRAEVATGLFVHFDEDNFPDTTLPALALAEAAYEMDPTLGEAVSLAHRDALFEQGRDVSDPEVLAEIASAHGVPPAQDSHSEAVRELWEEGKTRGVIGSPHFFTPSGGFFCPALDIERVDGRLRICFETG
jgi:predicted DsbA family dithiol-disulfide isomerase